MSQTVTQVAGGGQKHPRGLYVLFLTEMWERFSYYLMLGIFYQYLIDSQTGGMGWSGTKAASVVGSYIALVYFTPFLGGLLADRVLGYRKTIFIGGFFFIAGHTLLAFEGEAILYTALLCLILGNGCFKANISTMVGRLYPQGSPLRDSAYTIFYMGINVGAFICNFVAAVVRNSYGWHGAFLTAGIGMAIGVVTFAFGQRWIREADITPEERASSKKDQAPILPLFTECLGPSALMFTLGAFLGGAGNTGLAVPYFAENLGWPTTAFILSCIPVVWFFVRIWLGLKDPTERGRVAALLTIFGVVIVFWMVFHQNSTALTDWARNNTDRRPGAIASTVTDNVSMFAETAPPDYYYNAGPDTPRPDPSTFEIVSPARYEELEKAKQLAVEQGKTVPVTQEIFDKVYANTDASTPRLPPKQHVKLVNTELFQSINGGLIILFAPLMVALWTFLGRRRKEPSIAAKIGGGLVFTGLSAVVMIGAVAAAGTPEGKVAPAWLWGTYAVITIGELWLSPIGLSMVSKLSPRRIAGFMMGGWFLSTAIGNKLSGVFGELYHKIDHTTFFTINAGTAIAAGGVIFLLLPWLRRQMAEMPVGTPPNQPTGEVADLPAGDLDKKEHE